MQYILGDLSHEAVTDAIEGNLGTFVNFLAGSPRVTLHDDNDVKWFVSDVPFPLLNGVVCANLTPGSEDARIDEILAAFKSAAVPMLWWTGPASRPSDLNSRLEARGLISAGMPPGMAVDLSKLDPNEAVPDGLIIKRLENGNMLEGYGQVLQKAFDLPGFVTDAYYDIFTINGYDETSDVQNYVGYLNGEPVAAGTVAYGAGVAGIYNIATAEDARGRGIGRAITIKLLLDARQRGYKIGVLEASEMGYNVYKKLGFQDYCTIHQYLFMAGS